MPSVSKQMLADAINSFDSEEFDTHAVEQYVLRKYPIEFAEDILRFKDSTDVFQQFSAAFSKSIGAAFPNQLAKRSKVDSVNLGGNESSNQMWRRVGAKGTIR